ncbi:MAG: hypothetical protein VX822_05375 [Candidatus Neomarinimicrobiota bacterium]|nr:hypothetical protein [Candidatus Neomarinimicrobiota bacterium]
MRKTIHRQIARASAATMILFLAVTVEASDKYDLQKRGLAHTFGPAAAQTYVYHTNGALWMGWDSYGNTGDQTCSAIVPGWVYPGCFTVEGGKGFLNYNCRAGYWIVGKVDGEYGEGTTGEYVVTRGTEPGATSQGWANWNEYNKEPWISHTGWTIPTLGMTVKVRRLSWSFPGTKNYYYKIGAPTTSFDFNDFVIEEMVLTNTGASDVTDLIVGGKADHDVTWNVPFPDWDYPFWTDDIVDYDAVTMTTMELDGDRQTSAANDFGIDDDGREYRGVRVAQTPINLNGKNHDELEPTDVTHFWWTGDEDPQTPAARWTFASSGSRDEDKKDVNPSPMDMRYLQAYGPFTVAAGDSLKLVFAVAAGAGLENTQNAARAAKQAYDWEYNLPKPPAAPQIATDGVQTQSDGTVKITWTYSDAQIAAVDPDLGTADFAGFRVYRAAAAPSTDNQALMTAEGYTADNISPDMVGSPSTAPSNEWPAHAAGPYSIISEGSPSDFGSGGTYSYVDENVAVGLMYWYYVAAYDKGGTSAAHGTVPSLESYFTMTYPLVDDPYGADKIPTAPPAFTPALETLTYNDVGGASSTAPFVAPNPWKREVMTTFFGADNPNVYFMRFYNVKAGQKLQIFDVSGNLIFDKDIPSSGSYDWNLVSRNRTQVTTGVYFWKVGDTAGKLAVIR